MSRRVTKNCGVCQSTFGDSDCVHFPQVAGTSDDPYVPELIIDPVTGNLVECGPAGLAGFLAPIYLNPPAAHVYGTIQEDLIIPWDTPWPLIFNNKRYDTDSMWDSDDGSKLTAKTGGMYEFTLQIRWKKTNHSTWTGDLAVFLRVNGADFIALDSFPVPGGDSFAKFSVSREVPLAAGSFVQALVKQDIIDPDEDGTEGQQNIAITIERMSPNFTALFLRPIGGMNILGSPSS